MAHCEYHATQNCGVKPRPYSSKSLEAQACTLLPLNRYSEDRQSLFAVSAALLIQPQSSTSIDIEETRKADDTDKLRFPL